MNLRDSLHALRKFWWLIIASSVVGTALAATYVYQATPIYEGSVQFFATTPTMDSDSPLQGDQFGQQRVSSYVELLQSQRLAERVAAETDLDLSVRDLMRRVEGEADLNTVLFTAFVRDSSPATVEEIVGALAAEFPALVEDIESQSGTKQAPVQLDVVSGPSVTSDPVSPVKRLWLALGLVMGALIGVALALLRAVLDRTVRTEESLRDVVRTPVLGRIPVDAGSRQSPLLGSSDTRWIRAEAFRQLRTNLQFVDIEEPIRVLVVTSSLAGEGKSSTAVNLAASFADGGRRVLLIEADLRRPTLARTLNLEPSVGVTNILAGQVSLKDVVQPWGNNDMHFVASGPIPPNPSELLGSQHMLDLLEEARESYDLVVIDTAPLLPVTDGAIASARADGAVVVVRYGKTRIGEVERALDALHAVDARVVGTVLNRTPLKGLDGYAYRGYSSGPEKRRARRRQRKLQQRRTQGVAHHAPRDSERGGRAGV